MGIWILIGLGVVAVAWLFNFLDKRTEGRSSRVGIFTALVALVIAISAVGMNYHKPVTDIAESAESIEADANRLADNADAITEQVLDTVALIESYQESVDSILEQANGLSDETIATLEEIRSILADLKAIFENGPLLLSLLGS